MDKIHIGMKSSNIEPALEHLQALRNYESEDSGGIRILIEQIKKARRRFR